MNSIDSAVQVLICIFEAYLFFDFFQTFFPLRKEIAKGSRQVITILIAAFCIYRVNHYDSTIVNVIGVLILYFIIAFTMFKGNYLSRFLSYVIVVFVMFETEFIFVLLLSVPSNLSMDYVFENQTMMIIRMIEMKLLTFILLNIIKRIPKHSNNRMDLHTFLMYIVLPISTLAIMIVITYMNIDYDKVPIPRVMLIISFLLALVGNALIFYAFNRYSISIEQGRKQDLMIERLKMEAKHFEQMEEVNREHIQLLHNVHHYLKVIREMAIEDNNEIARILSELQIKFSDAESKVFCEHKLLNAMLNEKKKEADKCGISCSIMVEPGFFIEQVTEIDLIAMVGNLLDNAVEAASKCEDGYIKVRMYMENENCFTIIKISNCYAGPLKVKNGILLTSKEVSRKHGIGLANVKELVEKYGGHLELDYGNSVFTVILWVPVLA